MNLSNIMDGLAALVTAAAVVKTVYAFPQESVTVPCAIVAYPTNIVFDATFQRGSDTVDIPVFFVVGKVSLKSTRDKLSSILTGVGSIKTALDGAHSFGDVRCTDATPELITIAAIDYMALRFDTEVLT
jgi:hypothetical protein